MKSSNIGGQAVMEGIMMRQGQIFYRSAPPGPGDRAEGRGL